MNTSRFPIPPVLLALDVFGVLLILAGVMALTGNDFGHPALVTAAPALIFIGVVLSLPMVVWAVRRGKANRNR